MKLVNGNIPAGETCSFSDECYFKEIACNGEGCPVAENCTVDYDFSCGAARFFNLFKEED